MQIPRVRYARSLAAFTVALLIIPAAPKSLSAQDVFASPPAIFSPQPEYPRLARVAGLTGVVSVQLKDINIQDMSAMTLSATGRRRAISLGAQQTQTTQAQTGVVTGVIRTANGAPIPGVRVAAMALPDPLTGAGEGALVSLAQTDTTGSYRLENIPPGRYYIQAGLVDIPTYYPGVALTSGATAVLIAAGSLLEKIDFPLTRGAGVTVRGRFPVGVARPSMIALTGGSGAVRSMTTTLKADGTFEFLKVPPGNFSLLASPANGLPTLPLVINDKDIDVGMPTGPGVKVSGVIGVGPRSPRPANQRVVFTGASAWAQVDAPLDSSGKFEIPSLPPGTYSVRTQPGGMAPIGTVVIADREISGVTFPTYTEVAGRVVLQDGKALPRMSPALMIEAKPAKGATFATAVRADGVMRFPLLEGQYRIAPGKLPSGFVLKSISYGAVDLLKDPLILDGSADLGEIRILLETNR